MIQTVYLHGLPGGAEELQLGSAPLGWIVPDRLAWRSYESGLSRLVGALPNRCRLVGFSLGAMTALRLAAQSRDRVEDVTLISPAAPLETGNYLRLMAGRRVFESARRGGLPLHALTILQSAIARFLPQLTVRLLFSGTSQAECAVAEAHSRVIGDMLSKTYGPGRAAYVGELQHYVRPWSHVLGAVSAPVTIHHGDADTWAPPAMGSALASALPDARLIRHPGLGHYGTLAAFLRSEARS